MLVMKFGGISVSEAARLRDLVGLVKAEPRVPLVVVCTALSGVTDALIGAARGAVNGDEAVIETTRRELWGRHRAIAERIVKDEWEREALYRDWAELLKIFDRVTRAMMTLGERSLRGIDAVAALGERFVAHLVAVALRQNGIAAQMLDASEIIVTDDHFGAARPLQKESMERIRKRMQPLMQARIVPVVTGYTGATVDHVVTTLGRGGGDYTAALVGAALGAEEVCIWTDVDGILTADPKIVGDARTLPDLSFAEAAEIATFGAEVLHPRTLVPLVGTDVVLHIRNVLHAERSGTRIVARPRPTTHAARTIISARGLSLVTLVASSDSWALDLAARAVSQLAAAGVEALTFAQSFSERSLALCVRSTDADFARENLLTIFKDERAGGVLHDISVTTPVALVVVIGSPNSIDLTPRTLSALGHAGAHVTALAQSGVAPHISFILPEPEVDEVVRVLHRELELA